MDLIRGFLFESPWLLLAAMAVALVVILAARRRGHVDGARRALLITVAAAAAVFLLQTLVVTDREALEALIVKLAEAVDEGDIAGIGSGVHSAGVDLGTSASAARCTKAAFLSACNVGLQQYRVEKPRVGGLRYEIGDSEATVSFRVSCDIQQGQATEYRMPSFWTVRCEKEPDGWRLRGIQKAHAGVEGLASVLDIMGYLRGFWSAGAQPPG